MDNLILAIFDNSKTSQKQEGQITIDIGQLTIVVSNYHQATLVHKVIRVLKEQNLEIDSIEQAYRSEIFALLIQAHYKKESLDMAELRSNLEKEGKKIKATFKVQRPDLFFYMHRL